MGPSANPGEEMALIESIKVIRLDIYDTPGNSFSDAFPIVEVQFVQHRDFQASVMA